MSLDKVAIALRARHFDDWFQWLATCIIKLSEKRIKLGAEERVIRGLIVDLFDDLEDLIDNCIWCGYVYPLGPRTHYKTCEKRKLLFK